MKDKIFGVLQRIGRSFMLPIAILPVAGLLLGVGSSFTNATMIETYHLQAILGEGTILNSLLTIMSKAGSIIFDNLPIIFARCSNRYGEEREGSCGTCGNDLFLCNECNNECHASDPWRSSCRRNAWSRSSGRNCDKCLRNPDITDGGIWRYYRWTWSSSTS